MEINNKLQSICLGLESTKATERKKCSDLLMHHIHDKKVVQFINGNGRITWNHIYGAVHRFLIKEAEKLLESALKKKSAVKSTNSSYIGDLLVNVVRVANRKEFRLSSSRLVKSILECFDSRPLRQCFISTYMNILQEYVLSVENNWGNIETGDWIKLLSFIKNYCRHPMESIEDSRLIQCLDLILQRGPLHGLPGVHLRQEFSFIKEICSKLSSSLSRFHQEAVFKLLIRFCTLNARDCRLACCKLGEDVFKYLIALYEARTCDSEVKIHFFELMLLQICLHQPKGAVEGSIAAYAFSWPAWRKCLHVLYSVICHEISYNEKVKYKSIPLFGSSNDQNELHPVFVALIVNVLKQIFHSGVSDVTQASVLNFTVEETQPQAKRQRVEAGVSFIISTIQEKRLWPWINILTHLLKKHPDIIEAEDFKRLLQVLCELQTEGPVPSVRYHLYKCLHVMVDVQGHLKGEELDLPCITLQWSIVWESTLRIESALNVMMIHTHKLSAVSLLPL